MKVAIIGGGASGLACAIEMMNESSENSLKLDVTVFEKNERVGKKLLSTGNGRCNMLNLTVKSKDYYDASSFVSYALDKFPPESNIRFFEALGLFTHSDEEGRVYPLSNQASGVLDVLRFACERLGVRICVSEPIEKISKKGKRFVLNNKLEFDNVVICAGSKAAVKSFNGYELLESLSHKITKTAPSLVKLSTPANETKQLKGIRAGVCLRLDIYGKTIAEEKGELLFGENTLSGIVSMQLSPYISRHFLKSTELPVVYADFVPGYSTERLAKILCQIIKNNPRCETQNLLIGFMPKKIGEVIMKKSGVSLSSPVSVLDNKAVTCVASLCKKYPFKISGVKSFSEAQVVTGGADLNEFDCKTLESKKVSGLYCCGEILNVDGPCGGYNLGWAWSSARVCASAIINQIIKKQS